MQYIVVVKEYGDIVDAVGYWSRIEYARTWIDENHQAGREYEIVRMYHPTTYTV